MYIKIMSALTEQDFKDILKISYLKKSPSVFTDMFIYQFSDTLYISKSETLNKKFQALVHVQGNTTEIYLDAIEENKLYNDLELNEIKPYTEAIEKILTSYQKQLLSRTVI